MKVKNRIPIVVILALFIPLAMLNAQYEQVPGTVIDHSPASSNKFIGSPSIVILPNGDYVASHDFFAKGGNRGIWGNTLVFRSPDKGKTWHYMSTLENQYWSTLFYHNNALYIIGTYGSFGSVVIRRSLDGGITWTEPTDDTNGIIAEGRFHCAPVPVVSHDGRLWRAMEYAEKNREFESFMMSVPENADLLKAENWTFSEKLTYSTGWRDGQMKDWLEGNAVVSPENGIVNIIRCGFNDNTEGIAAMISISEDGRKASFDPETGFISMPGGTGNKFTIRFDEKSGKYWSLTNWVMPRDHGKNRKRNTVALISSRDLRDWTVERIVLHHPDNENHAFQYLDWQFEGNDIIAVSRTAWDDLFGGAANHHDANFLTFHRIENFRRSFNLD